MMKPVIMIATVLFCLDMVPARAMSYGTFPQLDDDHQVHEGGYPQQYSPYLCSPSREASEKLFNSLSSYEFSLLDGPYDEGDDEFGHNECADVDPEPTAKKCCMSAYDSQVITNLLSAKNEEAFTHFKEMISFAHRGNSDQVQKMVIQLLSQVVEALQKLEPQDLEKILSKNKEKQDCIRQSAGGKEVHSGDECVIHEEAMLKDLNQRWTLQKILIARQVKGALFNIMTFCSMGSDEIEVLLSEKFNEFFRNDSE